MKKIVILSCLSFALIIVILSCKKNQSDSAAMNYQTMQLPESHLGIEQRILAFKSSIEGTLKTGFNYPIDTVVRYIEGLLNYTYGDVANNLQGVSVDSIFISVDLYDGKIAPMEVNSVYNEIIDSLTIQYQNLPTQNLHLVLADVFRKDSISGSVILGVTSVFAYGSPLDVDHFGENDYWMYGFREVNAGGYCDGSNQGQNTDEDAASKIRDYIRMRMGLLPTRHYTMDVIPAWILYDLVLIPTYPVQHFDYVFINPNDEVPGDNMYDFLLLEKWSNINPFDTCLIPDEMNFYTYGANHILYEEIYTATEGTFGARVPLHLEIKGDHGYYNYYPHSVWHEMQTYYGVIIYNSEDPEIFD